MEVSDPLVMKQRVPFQIVRFLVQFSSTKQPDSRGINSPSRSIHPITKSIRGRSTSSLSTRTEAKPISSAVARRLIYHPTNKSSTYKLTPKNQSLNLNSNQKQSVPRIPLTTTGPGKTHDHQISGVSEKSRA